MNELQLQQSHQLEPVRDVRNELAMCEVMMKSNAIPGYFRKPEQVWAVVTAGRELGLAPFAALRGIYLIDGKPVISADAIVGLALKSGLCEYFVPTKLTGTEVTFETKRKGSPTPVSYTYTLEQAKLAAVTGKDNWRKYPEAMLKARCISTLGRMVYPDVLMGVYAPEEFDYTSVQELQQQAEVRARAEENIAVEVVDGEEL